MTRRGARASVTAGRGVALAFLVLAPALAGCASKLLPGGADEAASSTPATRAPTPSPFAPKKVNAVPIARIAIHPEGDDAATVLRAFPGVRVTLDGSASEDRDGRVLAWEWEVMEPGISEPMPPPTRLAGERVEGVTFDSPGVKVIRLAVTDNASRKGTALATFLVDARHEFGEAFHWEPVTEEKREARDHAFPVIPGAAAIDATISTEGGARAELVLLDPDGVEVARGGSGDGNATLRYDAAPPASGDWTLRVELAYAPSGITPCAPAPIGCQTVPAPVEPSHDAAYAVDAIVWYGLKPELTS